MEFSLFSGRWRWEDTYPASVKEMPMSEGEIRTHLAEVVRHEVVPGQVGETPEHILALWAPLVQKRFEVRLRAVPLSGADAALEEEFPLGCKVVLTETGERMIQMKRLVSSQQAGH